MGGLRAVPMTMHPNWGMETYLKLITLITKQIHAPERGNAKKRSNNHTG